ncbi:MAG: hypothetical protein WCG34_06795 [Leptolinea sp.]
MDSLKPLVDLKDIKTDNLKINGAFNPTSEIDYDDLADILQIRFFPNNSDVVVHYLDENLGLLYEPSTMQVVGFHIEGFSNSFLKKNPVIAKSWNVDPAAIGNNLFEMRNLVIDREVLLSNEFSRISKRKIKEFA